MHSATLFRFKSIKPDQQLIQIKIKKSLIMTHMIGSVGHVTCAKFILRRYITYKGFKALPDVMMCVCDIWAQSHLWNKAPKWCSTIKKSFKTWERQCNIRMSSELLPGGKMHPLPLVWCVWKPVSATKGKKRLHNSKFRVIFSTFQLFSLKISTYLS